MNQNEVLAAIAIRRQEVERRLDLLRIEKYSSNEPLSETINYILAGEGKRVRGMLAVLCAELYSQNFLHGINAAMALEMIHAYSLAHDDLPCLDDDDMRRGRMSAHKMFDVPRALLAGDALLTDAFWVLTADADSTSPWSYAPFCGAELKLRIVRELAIGAGGSGMVHGQMLDVHWTGKSDQVSLDILDRMHLEKTGALLGAACAMGALSGGANQREAEEMRHFGQQIGLAYQVVDDLLDSEAGTGKSVGKDVAQGKSTYVTTMGRDEARDRAASLTKEALSFIKRFHDRGTLLNFFVSSLLDRKK